MGIVDSKEYRPDCSFDYSDPDTYYNKTKTFGKFTECGSAYRIAERNTPRPWLQYLCNDKIRSVVSNTGKGFIWHCRDGYITKHWERNYIVRNVNGKRSLKIKTPNGQYDFFEDADGFSETVRPGSVFFNGTIENIFFEVTLFVPRDIPCECMRIHTVNQNAEAKEISLSVGYEVFPNHDGEGNVKNFILFAGNKFEKQEIRNVLEKNCADADVCVSNVSIIKELHLLSGASESSRTFFGVFHTENEKKEILKLSDEDVFDRELQLVKNMWEELFAANSCTVPDKNFEYFLNFWLKNQLFLTCRYNRGEAFNGYRDSLQDSWGYCLVEPRKAKEKILQTLSYMYPDGRCPRQYNPYDNTLDARDFSDSPIWAADAVSSYMKETGDFDFFYEKTGFFGSEEQTSVEDHLFRALDYLYHSRGKNGLVLIRDGDWADGLGGINKFGEDATSVWLTIAVFYAQNVLKEIYGYLKDREKEALMAERSEEYREIVNKVGWNGKWFTYGFFEDGEPIGSPENPEGKIWLNPQTWAIFSGIVTDDQKIEKINKEINRYLLTPFGAMVCYPPYMFHGDRCGRVWRQIPGTFLNGAIYNHAATFKIFSDIARNDSEEAFESFMRALPNHPDNSDCSRTSEPYAVGNVYFGPNNPRYGMNLYTWFTAAAAWLIHAGFEQILGVKADFDGLRITPHVPASWDAFSVKKLYRGTVYNIQFIRGKENKGIFADGKRINGNLVHSDEKICNIKVII